MPPVTITAETTRRRALRLMRRVFTAAEVDTPALDARLLLCAVLGIDAVKLITEADRPVGDRAETLTAVISRRVAREPVSRILGRRDFYGRDFEVTPATLDPRPDTETVIDVVLKWIDGNGGRARPWRILDVGTGTGCLAITLLAELPEASGMATDISREALAVAARNADHLGVASRLTLLLADGIEELADRKQVFDIMVSNPPYIRSDDIATLDPEVKGFDPPLALDGGDDGLAFYRRLIDVADAVVPDGYVCFEVGHDQAGSVVALLRGFDWSSPQVWPDLAGVPRCVTQITQR